MKNLFKFIGIAILIGIIALIVGLVMLIKGGSGGKDLVNGFLNDIWAENYDLAYDRINQEFRDQTSLENFIVVVQSSGLNTPGEVHWTGFNMVNSMKGYSGFLVTENNDTLALQFNIMKEEGDWKIVDFQAKSLSAASGQTPPIDEILVLVDDYMMLLAHGINQKDFTSFYNDIAAIWKAQITAEQIRAQFITFVVEGIDLTIIKDTQPVLSSAPVLDHSSFLIVQGYYPMKEMTIQFTMQFANEYPDWKLAGINIEIN